MTLLERGRAARDQLAAMEPLLKERSDAKPTGGHSTGDGAAMELIARRHTRHRTEMVREALDMFEGRSKSAAKSVMEPLPES